MASDRGMESVSISRKYFETCRFSINICSGKWRHKLFRILVLVSINVAVSVFLFHIQEQNRDNWLREKSKIRVNSKPKSIIRDYEEAQNLGITIAEANFSALTTEIESDSKEFLKDLKNDTFSKDESKTAKCYENEVIKKISSSTSGFEIENNENSDCGCKIPKLDPFDPKIRHVLKKEGPAPRCLENFTKIFNTAEDSTIIQEQSSKVEWKDCCYKLIFRANNPTTANTTDNSETYSKNCFPISNIKTKIPPDHEFIAIHCINGSHSNKTLKMVDAFALVHLKPSVEKRIAALVEQKKNNKSKVNLVVLGLDGLSHMNFQRTMPKVYEYLVKNLSAVGMNGYNKIEDNTLPNVLALLTPWNKRKVDKDCYKSNFYDDCPFIWKSFSSNGYRTSYGEDTPWLGIFNYHQNGFRKPPTDYYLRPFSISANEYISSDNRPNPICYGPRTTLQVLINYMQKTAATMGKDKRYFQFIWSTALTHDRVNEAKWGQDHLLSALQWFKSKGYLENTVFVLMSDHGMRFGPIRYLQQGKIEDSMPLMYLVFPEWFKKKYRTAINNMISNRNRLTTPFDGYKTFKDILFLENIEEAKIFKRMEKLRKLSHEGNLPRGISMFLPVPKMRTCEMAEIPQQFCVCHTFQSLSINDSVAIQGAHYAVFAINRLINKFPQCAYLSLSSVTQAQLIHKQKKVKERIRNRKVADKIVSLVLETTPGEGMFETTVVKKASKGWQMSGSFSRINKYGNQSYCVDDKDMKKYCYCLGLIT